MKRRTEIMGGLGLRRLCVAVVAVGVVAAMPAPALASAAGQLYAFGLNDSGELGSTTNNDSGNPNPTPGLVSLPGATGPVVQAAAGGEDTLAVTSTGQLYAFGGNQTGELGRATNSGTLNPSPTPAPVALPGATGPVVQVAAGQLHSLAVTATGQLYAFGRNTEGELGSPANNDPNPTPALVTLPGATGPVVQVAAGGEHSLALTSTGQLYAFGRNNYGELGSATNNGTDDPNPAPMLVALPASTGPVVQVAAGSEHSLAVTSTGQLYAFGLNSFGQLGRADNIGTDNPNPAAALVALPGATGPVVQVAAGSEHSLAVTSTGQLYAFGDNTEGQLGGATTSGATIPNPTPAVVSLPGATGPVVQVAAGLVHSLAVTSTGQLYSFGDNSFGQLGFPFNSGTANANPMPALVELPGGVSVETVARGPGAFHTLAVLADLSVVTGSLLGGTVGRPYSAQLASSGGAGRVEWSARGLPAGLALDPAAGTISGTPTTAGAFTVNVIVTDADRIAASRTLSLMIAPSAPSVSSVPVLSGLVVFPRRISLAGRTVHGRCQPLARSNRRARPCRMKLKLHLTFSMSAAGTVTLTFARVNTGRRVNGRCTKPTRRNHRHPHCTRLTTLPGSITRTAKPGANQITITRTNLAPGTYQITITPEAAPDTGKPHTTTITITR
jgi:alpha-tubulin suppressor-like RCC1 family protein